MPTILITGTNRGLGLEFTRQFLNDSWQVFACARSKSKELLMLEKQYPQHLSLHDLDVTDGSAIHDLSEELKQTPLDLIISNSGIYGGEHQSLGSIDYEDWMHTFEVDTLPALRLAEAFESHLMQGEQKRFVAITSLMGSITDNTSGGYYLYRSSKAALNMAIKSLSIDWQPKAITAIVLHPGWVQTDMGGKQAPTQPEESIRGMREMISKLSLKDTGKFFDFRGRELPW